MHARVRSRRADRRLSVIVPLLSAAALTFAPPAPADRTERASVGGAGGQASAASGGGALDADGRVVAFHSDAPDLVPGDTNATADVFVRDRRTGRTERVSADAAGAQGNGESRFPSVSADGRFVAFHSAASDLVPGDTNGRFDVFVHDRRTGAIARVSVDDAGRQMAIDSLAAAISADGRFVAFHTGGGVDVYIRDRRAGRTEQVNLSSTEEPAEPPSFSSDPAVSGDGRFVAFASFASGLVPVDPNSGSDVFVRDRGAGTTERVSPTDGVGFDASLSPAISADGRFVTFSSEDSSLVAGDTNLTSDVFVRDRRAGTTERVSVDSAGVQGNHYSFGGGAAISADGRYVTFLSFASNLVPGDTNEPSEAEVFVRDRRTGTTERVSVDSAGGQANGASFEEAIAAGGRSVAFTSLASNLVPGDTNGVADVFVRDRSGTGTPGDRLRALIRTVADLAAPRGLERSLIAKLRRALAAAEDRKPNTSPCPALRAFLSEVRAQSGHAFTVAEAERLRTEARQIERTLGCPGRS